MTGMIVMLPQRLLLWATIYRLVNAWHHAKYLDLHDTSRRRDHYPHFMDKKNEAQRASVIACCHLVHKGSDQESTLGRRTQRPSVL